MVEKTKASYKNWILLHRNIPRTQRFGIGQKIDTTFLELLECLRHATYASLTNKVTILTDCLSKTDSLRFFIQLLWEANLISDAKFSSLGSEIENIGKMIGGWRKGLITKLPRETNEGERKK